MNLILSNLVRGLTDVDARLSGTRSSTYSIQGRSHALSITSLKEDS